MRFELDDQQRDFAASIDAALAAADMPAAVRAWAAGDTAPGRKVWARLADLGVTALAVPERFGGIEAHPVDLVVAFEQLGRWCVPGPVTESIAVAPVLMADDDRAEGLASGELIATVALPPAVPRAVDAGAAGLVLLACEGVVSDATPHASHASVDPSRRLYDVSASGDGRPADVPRAFEAGALATAAQLIGAGQAMLSAAVDYAKQRTQFGRLIGSYQAIKHKLADVYVATELARSNAYYGAWALASNAPELPVAAAAARISANEAFFVAAKENIQVHGGMGYTWQFDCHLYYRRAKLLSLALGSTRLWKDRLIGQLETANAPL